MTLMPRTSLLALTAAAAIVAAAPAAFAQPYGYGYGNPPVVAGVAPPLEGRPLTVAPRQRYGNGYGYSNGYNPYNNGIGTIVTGPTQVASELAALPFRVVNAIFPADPRSPLSIIGAPVYAAGQVVQAPFHIIQAPFGDRTIYGQ